MHTLRWRDAQAMNREPLQVDYLWWAECPSHDAGYVLLEQALAAEGVTVPIRSTEIVDDDDAQRYAFPGSPTIRLNGQDIDPLPEPSGAASPYALTCRAYRREDGRIAPLPSPAQLRAAIRRALDGEAAPN
jgi:hypothetical protein